MKTGPWTHATVMAWLAERDAWSQSWSTRFLTLPNGRGGAYMDVMKYPSGGYQLAAAIDTWVYFGTAERLAAAIMGWVERLRAFTPSRMKKRGECPCPTPIGHPKPYRLNHCGSFVVLCRSCANALLCAA